MREWLNGRSAKPVCRGSIPLADSINHRIMEYNIENFEQVIDKAANEYIRCRGKELNPQEMF